MIQHVPSMHLATSSSWLQHICGNAIVMPHGFLRTPVDFLVSFCQTPRFLNEWIVSPFQQLWEAFLLRTPKARLKGWRDRRALHKGFQNVWSEGNRPYHVGHFYTFQRYTMFRIFYKMQLARLSWLLRNDALWNGNPASVQDSPGTQIVDQLKRKTKYCMYRLNTTINCNYIRT